jgi:beta-D-xylosidase 4
MKLSRCALAGIFAANGVLGFQYPDCVNGPLANNTVCDTRASPSDRAAALVKVMNITEKLSNLVECVTPVSRLNTTPLTQSIV